MPYKLRLILKRHAKIPPINTEYINGRNPYTSFVPLLKSHPAIPAQYKLQYIVHIRKSEVTLCKR